MWRAGMERIQGLVNDGPRRFFAALLVVWASAAQADLTQDHQTLKAGWAKAGELIKNGRPEFFSLKTPSEELALDAYLELREKLAADYEVTPSTWFLGNPPGKACAETEPKPGAKIFFYAVNCAGITADEIAKHYLHCYAAHFKPFEVAAAFSKSLFASAEQKVEPNLKRYRELLACDWIQRGKIDDLLTMIAPMGPVPTDARCAGQTPLLHRSILSQQWKVAKFLLDRKVAVDLKDAEGFYALQRLPLDAKPNDDMKEILRALVKQSLQKQEIIADAIRFAVVWKDSGLLKELVELRVHVADSTSVIFAQTLGLSAVAQDLDGGIGRRLEVKRIPDYKAAGMLLDEKLVDLNAAIFLFPKAPAYRPLIRMARLTYAADLSFLSRLIDQNADLALKDEQGYTAADWATSYRKLYQGVCTGKLLNTRCVNHLQTIEKSSNPKGVETLNVPIESLSTSLSHERTSGNGQVSFNFSAWCTEGLKECR